MQKITTFLTFDDQAEEAVDLYTSAFEGSSVLDSSRYPDQGEGAPGKVMSITFELSGQTFIALNGGPTFQFSEGISLYVECQDQGEVDRLWEALSKGGGKGRCGWLTDRFGVSWQIIPRRLGELLGDPDPERAGRAMQAMLQMDKIIIEDLERAADGL
jgi:predicted 3-demethylubiquinone-9 3-methyltransferase (glyoxalase superfamily)